MEDMKKNAKLKVLQELKKMASDMMGGDIHDGMMKKVSVAAPSSEGLKMGLDKAKELVGDKHPMEDSMMSDDAEEAAESPEEEAAEGPEGEADEDLENCTPEELDAKIAKLQAMKAKMKSGHNPY